jgi:hypothetical protein
MGNKVESITNVHREHPSLRQATPRGGTTATDVCLLLSAFCLLPTIPLVAPEPRILNPGLAPDP